jgi:zinc D-Ala-D-Ala carboxypeptidase
MRLTKDFTLKELCVTKTGIHNEPNAEQKEALRLLAVNILQPARDALGPIRVTSGFRNAKVNAAVGGSRTSQHTKAEAADLQCDDNAALFKFIKTLDFDQLIWEFGDKEQPDWVHVSFSKRNRKEVLRAKRVGGQTKYTPFK